LPRSATKDRRYSIAHKNSDILTGYYTNGIYKQARNITFAVITTNSVSQKSYIIDDPVYPGGIIDVYATVPAGNQIKSA